MYPSHYTLSHTGLIHFFKVIITCLLAVLLVSAFQQHPLANGYIPLLNFDGLALTVQFQLNPLAMIMLLLVSVITLIIVQYSQRYLLSDVTRLRFIIQLLLVSTSVGVFVLSNNLFTAFIGWQWIGLNLYLLLNHYHYDLQANRAAKKKFVINRIGDLCFLIAVILMYQRFGDSHFTTLFHAHHVTDIVTLLFIAVMTKSAQLPFHIWLPDTMETPTPVSALMHAGVINSGGFLLARISPALVGIQWLMIVITLIGLATAILGTYWMQQQPDTKKKLAYSTMGQMGYMVMQCGLGVFSAAIFHLIAHGFFKATLFLNVGETIATHKHTKHKPAGFKPLLASTLLAAIVTVLLDRLAHAIHVVIPPLLLGFMLVTMIQLFLATLRQHSAWLTKHLIIIGVALLGVVYVVVLAALNHYLALPDIAKSLPLTLQWVLVAMLIAVTLCLSQRDPNTHAKRTHDHTEALYRRWLLYPLRQTGEWGVQCLSPLTWVLLVTLGLVTLFGLVIFALFPHVGIVISVWVVLGLLLIGTLVLNRLRTLQHIFLWLAMIALCFAMLGLFNTQSALHRIGCFHVINMIWLMLLLALITLSRRQHTPTNTQRYLRFNKLPWRVFYLSMGLLLMIGIPGSASFVTEFYLFHAFANSAGTLLLYGVVMFLLSISIMHILQVFVFDHDHISARGIPLPWWSHGCCWLAIGINVANGMWPHTLLSLLGPWSA